MANDLAGRTVVVTRPQGDEAPLAARLEERGARVISCPAIRFTRADDPSWRDALERRTEVTHLVFTSANGVRFLLELSERDGVPRDAWLRCRIAAIGEHTAEAVHRAGLRVDFIPRSSTGTDLAVELVEAEQLGPGSVVLLPQSDIARSSTAEHLEDAGVTVLPAAVYSTRPEDPARARPLLEALDRGERVDAIVFASPSAVAGFLEMTGQRGHDLLASGTTRVVTIGPVTSEAVRERGLHVEAQAPSAGPEGLLRGLEQALGTS